MSLIERPDTMQARLAAAEERIERCSRRGNETP